MERHQQSDADNIPLAVFAIVFTVFALSLGDALIKQISTGFPLWQIFVMRSAMAIAVVIAVLKTRFPSVSLKPRTVVWTGLRSLMLTLMWVAYYAALPHVALSIAAAGYYTLPLFITLFAAIFIGEKVGVQGWIAVCTGFCGVLLILRPEADDFNAYALLPLASAVLYALSMILTRTKSKHEHPLVLSLCLNISMACAGAVASVFIWLWGPSGAEVETHRFLLDHWIVMDMQDWLAMALLAAAVLIGSVGAAVAYQKGPASIVATFDFSYLAFATLWGALFFAEFPDAVTIAGMALIVVAGVLGRPPITDGLNPPLPRNAPVAECSPHH